MTKIVFSSEQLPDELEERKRYLLWRDLYTAQFGEVDMDWSGEGRFRASTQFVPLGDTLVGHFDFTFNRVARTRAHLKSNERDELIFGFAKSGQVLADLHGHDVSALPGSVALYTNGKPADFRSQSGIECTSVVLPRALLAACVPNLDDAVGRLLDPEKPAVRLLGRYVDLLLTTEIGDEPALRDHVSTTLIDLARLALDAEGEAAQAARMRGLRGARLQQILEGIRSSFEQPDFSSEMLARGLGLSQRYVNKLLLESGQTFAERVQELRLQKARATLLDARNNRLKVSEIAHASGFNDISYFNRRFRARFGCSPTQYRAGKNNA